MSQMRVYRYGLLPPTENADRVREQMRLAHAYRNKLVEIERARRAAVRAAEAEAGDIATLTVAAKDAEAALLAIVTEKHRLRAKSRTLVDSPELRVREKAAREVRKSARQALFAARKRLREDGAIRERIDTSYQKATGEVKAARAASGLADAGPHFGAFGTYLLVEAAAEQSCKTTPLYDGVTARDPRFLGWRHVARHRVGVQIGKGAAVGEVLGGECDQLQIGAVSEAAWLDRNGGVPREANSGRRPKMRTTLRMLIERERSRGPIVWAAWPMIMHRPLPEEGVIKNAYVAVERVGPRESWYVCFTVDCSRVPRRTSVGVGRVALAVGWRERPGRHLRVAATVDDQGGAPAAVALDPTWRERFEKAQDLVSIRKKNFNEALGRLLAWRDGRGELPEWFVERTKTLADWKSEGRLAALAKEWRDKRFAEDEAAYLDLETWRYKDHHLWSWETGQRKRTLLARREVYRVLGADLAKTYAELVLASFDKRKVARRGSGDVHENETARHNRMQASVSELEGAVANAFLAAGGTVTRVDVSSAGSESGAGATHECHACGYPNEFDAALPEIVVRCAGCVVEWDMDENCARNMLKRRERAGDAPPAGGSRDNATDTEGKGKYEGRHARMKRRKAEKAAAADTAREGDEKAAE